MLLRSDLRSRLGDPALRLSQRAALPGQAWNCDQVCACFALKSCALTIRPSRASPSTSTSSLLHSASAPPGLCLVLSNPQPTDLSSPMCPPDPSPYLAILLFIAHGITPSLHPYSRRVRAAGPNLRFSGLLLPVSALHNSAVPPEVFTSDHPKHKVSMCATHSYRSKPSSHSSSHCASIQPLRHKFCLFLRLISQCTAKTYPFSNHRSAGRAGM